MQKIISGIKKNNPDLKEAEIRGILYLLLERESLDNNELIRLTGIPKPIIKTFKSSIATLLVPDNKDVIELTKEARQEFKDLKLKPYNWSVLQMSSDELLSKAKAFRSKYLEDSKRNYDQFFATPESSVGKVNMLEAKGMVADKNIALIGDDDLVSLLLFNTDNPPNEVDVFEIDDDLIKFLNEIKDTDKTKYSNLTIHKYDARDDFSNNIFNKYDAVLIDPPYTIAGVQLFLYRAIELLKKFSNFDGNYILLNFGGGLRNPEKETKIVSLINRVGLLIEDKINKYTRYIGAETVGSASSIYVLKTTPFVKLDTQILNNKIYTYEGSDVENFPYVDHVVIKAQKVPSEIVNSKKALQKVFGIFCKKHRLKVVDTKITKFKGQGVSITYVLANSNLVVHSWPEMGAIHIDLITCSPIFNKDHISENLSKLLETRYIETRIME